MNISILVAFIGLQGPIRNSLLTPKVQIGQFEPVNNNLIAKNQKFFAKRINKAFVKEIKLSSVTTNRSTKKKHGTNYVQISIGKEFACALTIKGSVDCWGDNGYGQRGNNSRIKIDKNTITAVEIPENVKFSQISAGGWHVCALTTTNKLYCWGYDTFTPEVQKRKILEVRYPVEIKLSPNVSFQQISAGNRHTCVLSSSHDIYCWGFNFYGQLGNGTSAYEELPNKIEISNGLKFNQVDSGGYRTCAVSDAGKIYCWGWNITEQPQYRL